ncbi:sarcosine oxidase subunit gamma [Arthrobacter sp. ov118]|uniref:sarcosine oxidase subunit gamma n=1 Tax=Arthrobacter sp. ov118 TaxID=1761747 RepID=UPI0008E1262A|nr:sarcosine oxidase subunit gamma family protein [Arthrobacter sp. ov118]SFT52188.1 sarcosine oxidase subunit gamma [Arthrobacter sp. ov118]
MAETATSHTSARNHAEKDLAVRTSPASHLLEAFAAGSLAGTVELAELPYLTLLGVRAAAGTETADRLASVTGGLPAASGEIRGSGETSVLWLGPAEFLVVAPAEAHESLGGALIQALQSALADGEGQVVDLSANRTTFELTGPRARAVLEKGCSLDLHPREFKAGTAFSTMIGNIPAILWKTGEESFRVLPRASFADFLGRWLLDAMREYASAEVP